MLDSQWFRTSPPGAARFPPKWTFDKEMGKLSPAAFNKLLEIHLAHNGVKQVGRMSRRDLERLNAGEQVLFCGIPVRRKDLVTTLKLMAVSEYCLDSLLVFPPNLRRREVQKVAGALRVSSGKLRNFYLRWHERFRQDVYRTIKRTEK